MSSRFPLSRTIYVGNLPGDTREREVEDIFYKYGRIVDIDLKIPPRPPGYAFVEFEDSRDAEDAVDGRDGYEFDGYRLRVEMAHGGRAAPAATGGFRSGAPRTGGISRRTEYRVIVKGLPSSASWQDLKDHMRKAGDVCFAQVFKDRGGMMGIVDYTNEDDMKYACRKLDDSEFRNPFARGSYIRVYAEKDYKGRERSYSRSPDRGRSNSRSRSRSASPRRRHNHDESEDDDDEGDRDRGKDSSKGMDKGREDSEEEDNGEKDGDNGEKDGDTKDDSDAERRADAGERDVKDDDREADDRRSNDED